MHYMDEEAARLVVRFLRSATVNHHVTPLVTGSSAARRLARAAAARRGTAGDVDPFHRAPVSLVVLVHPAVSARFAQIGPVGGLVTGSAKLRIDSVAKS